MKKTVIIVSIIALIANSCGQTTEKQSKTVNNETVSERKDNVQQQKEDSQSENEQSDTLNKFLITNNSAGYFTIGEPWQDFAKNKYQYEFVQGYGSCVDACCKGGFYLGNGIIKNEWDEQILEDLKLTVGSQIFEENDAESWDDEIGSKKYKNDPTLFYVSSDNCKGWYWKDEIGFIILYSDLFKTKEGVSVGTTLEDAQKQLGKLLFDIGWIEENPNAVQFKISSYPNIEFILKPDDYAGNWEELSGLRGKGNMLTISDFKENTTIKQIIIRGEDEE